MDDDDLLKISFDELKDEYRKLENELKILKSEKIIKSNNQYEDNIAELDYKVLVDSSFDWFWVIDKDLNYTYCSPQVESILGYTPSELIGTSPFDIMDNDERRKILSKVEPDIKNHLIIKDLENWVIKKDDSRVCLLTNAFPLFNESGEFAGYQGADRDITYRRVADKTIREIEHRFQTIVEDLMIGIVIHDGNTIKYVNPFMLKMIGANDDKNFIGKSIFDFIHEDDFQIVIDKYNNVQSLKYDNYKGVLPPINIRIYKTDGSLLDVETHSILIKYDNEEHSLAIIQDITERIEDKNRILKALIKSEESDALKSAFLQNLSHEIRTPLNGILGFSSLLGRGDDLDKSEINEITKFIQDSGKRLINIVEQIIEISKIETEQISIENKIFATNDLLDDLDIYYSFDIKAKNLSFYNLKTEGLNVLVNSDYKKIFQIYSNLIENSIKFTQNGSIAIGFYQENDNVVFYVKDTGIGIDDQDKLKIFEKFSQVDFNTSRKFEGAGIGLAICKGLVKLIDGKIWFESEKNIGSTFFFSIPINRELNDNEKNNQNNSIDFLNNKILIVDDDLAYLKYCNKLFKNIQLNIKTASNGREALQIIHNSNEICLLITDIIMPEMDGFSLAIKTKEFNPKVKIIAQTNYNKIGEINKISDFGIDAVIFKPFEKEELFTLIQSIYNT